MCDRCDAYWRELFASPEVKSPVGLHEARFEALQRQAVDGMQRLDQEMGLY
jgi:hypothetical protein